MSTPNSIVRSLPSFMRTRPDCSVSFVTIGKCTYVLKLSSAALRGKELYKYLKHTNATPVLVYGGSCTVTECGRILGIMVDKQAVSFPLDYGIRILDKFNTKTHTSKTTAKKGLVLDAVMTLYDPKVVSVAAATREFGDTLITSHFTTNVLRLLAKLHHTVDFVHWDLHHHNQLIDIRTQTPLFLDFDYSTMRYFEKSHIVTSFRLNGFLLLLDKMHRSICGVTTTIDDTDIRTIGYAYDRLMVLISHEPYYRRMGREYNPINFPEKNLQIYYKNACRIVDRIGWRVHIVETVGLKGIDGQLQHHFKILFMSILVIAMERYGYNMYQIEKYFRKRNNK